MPTIRFIAPSGKPNLFISGVPAQFNDYVFDIDETNAEMLGRMRYLGAPLGVTEAGTTTDTSPWPTISDIAASIASPESEIGSAIRQVIGSPQGVGDIIERLDNLPEAIGNPASEVGSAIRQAINSYGQKVDAVGGPVRIHQPSNTAPTSNLQPNDLHVYLSLTGPRLRSWRGNSWVDLTGTPVVTPGTETTLQASAAPGTTSATITYETIEGNDNLNVTGVRVILGNTTRNLVALTGTTSFTGLTAAVAVNWSVQLLVDGAPYGTAVTGSVTPEAGQTSPDAPGGTATILTASVDVGNGQATLRWLTVLGTDGRTVSGVRYGHMGPDVNGNAYSTIGSPTGSAVLTNLPNGSPIEVFAVPQFGGVDDETLAKRFTVTPTTGATNPTPTDPTTPTTPTDPTTPTGTWYNGVSLAGNKPADTGPVATWRQYPIEIAATWSDSKDAAANLWAVGGAGSSSEYINWTRPIDIAVGAIFDGESWGNAASGAYRSRWRDQLVKLRQYRDPSRYGTTFIRFAHEFNGSWYPWRVNGGQEQQFIDAWRIYRQLQQEVFPEAKLVWCPNRETSGLPIKSTNCWPGAQYVDVIAVDYYGQYPGVPNDAAWNEQLLQTDGTGGPKGIEAWRRFGLSQGKPIAFSEYGANGDFGDGRAYIRNFLNFCKNNAGSGPGQVWYAIYFNATPPFGYDGRFGIYPSPRADMVEEADEYRNWHLANY